MAAATEKAPNKSKFITDYLNKTPTANAAEVNAAWTAAGRTGSISVTLVQKLRAELGLVGNRPRGRRGPRRGRGRAATNGKSSASAKATTIARSYENSGGVPGPLTLRHRALDKNSVLVELEANLDHLIYKLIELDDLPEVQDALRRARRIVVRSHRS
jgi:hypothetical protein